MTQNRKLKRQPSIRSKIENLEKQIRRKRENRKRDLLVEEELIGMRAEREQLKKQKEDEYIRLENNRLSPEQLENLISTSSITELEHIWSQRQDLLSSKLCCAKILSAIRFQRGIDNIPFEPEALTQHDAIKNLDLDDGFIPLPKNSALSSISTMRKRSAEITERTSQSKFRATLLSAYGCCPITGCKISQVLEAAHVIPFNGLNDNLKNGILLRADIHKLFDQFLLSINPETSKLELNPLIKNEYSIYKKIITTTVSNENLKWHFNEFKKVNMDS